MTVTTYLIAFALISQLIAQSQCSRMRDALSKNDVPRFLSRLNTFRLATVVIWITVYGLFGLSVVESIPTGLALVYTVNMTLTTLFVMSSMALSQTVQVAEKEGVYLDFMNHKITACEQILQAMIVTNSVSIIAFALKRVDYTKLKAMLNKKD